MRAFVREVKKKRGASYATVSSQGVGVVHLRKRVSKKKLESVARGLGFAVSSPYLKGHRVLEVRKKTGELVATVVEGNLLLLPKYARNRQASFDLTNALVG